MYFLADEEVYALYANYEGEARLTARIVAICFECQSTSCNGQGPSHGD